MKLDSNFIKRILMTMERQEDYIVNSHALLRELNIEGEKGERKFMGHILILGDEGLIEAINAKHPFGFVYSLEGKYSIVNTGYRLTSKGYEVLNVMKSSKY